MIRNKILPQMIDDCSKGIGSVSTPINSYEIQQIYSPFYLNYRAIASPYLSPNSSLPFLINTPAVNISFSSFDNAFNQTLFMGSNFTTENQGQSTNYLQ